MAVPRFDTSVLDAALQRQREEWEHERQRVVEQVRRFLDHYGQEYGIRQAYLFGSVARPGRFRVRSDVDLAVEQVDAGSFFRLIAHLSRELGRPVDVVELDSCRFADKIKSEGVPWSQPA